MEVRSTYKYARISPFKVREVTREIQGLPVSAALDVLAFTPKKAAFLINKTLKSAIATETRETRKAKRDQEKKAAGKEEVAKGSTAGKKPKARKKPAKKTKK